MTHCYASLWPQVIVEEVHILHIGLQTYFLSRWRIGFCSLSFIWLLEISLQFPSQAFLDVAHIMFVKGRCGGSVIRACIVSLTPEKLCAFIMIFFPVKDSSISALSPDAIMTLTSMMNGAVYIFSSIQTNQGHFAFLFLLSHQQYMFSDICWNQLVLKKTKTQGLLKWNFLVCIQHVHNRCFNDYII